jgi:hypothetical protein
MELYSNFNMDKNFLIMAEALLGERLLLLSTQAYMPAAAASDEVDTNTSKQWLYAP